MLACRQLQRSPVCHGCRSISRPCCTTVGAVSFLQAGLPGGGGGGGWRFISVRDPAATGAGFQPSQAPKRCALYSFKTRLACLLEAGPPARGASGQANDQQSLLNPLYSPQVPASLSAVRELRVVWTCCKRAKHPQPFTICLRTVEEENNETMSELYLGTLGTTDMRHERGVADVRR
ncbi:hypothetical protein IE81DRAFT_137366 [Ceraceosorus guamensis]|uniref:Uncharacterized protein n=1 Tax=Ceraceosorus guamensis TaxID=1522189 RepID=A0A316VXC5_9BASI|nr:hypothetical protein IE81DRAFT_137366 [Ceraceosorus guamensis]PWN42297.1 hypothetical protein IE81DRAFT_137366 [Ceraceosorus guamensis]